MKRLAGRILLGTLGLLAVGCGDSGDSDRRALSSVTQPTALPLLSDVLLQVRPGINVADLWQDYGLVGETVLPDGSTYRVFVGSGSGQQMIKLLQSDDRVAAAEENLPVRTPVMRQTSIAFDEGFLSTGEFLEGTPLGDRLELRKAHTGSKGRGVKVAILDTGVDADHKVLAGRISPESYDFIDGDWNPKDEPDGLDNDLDGMVDEATGHGTHVAGLVAMVAPAAKILCLRVLNSDGQGNAYNVAAAIEYAVNQGARVINMSLSLSSQSAAIDRAFDYARARDVILVTAAGNSGYIEYPAADSRVWAVAALGASGYPASFTSSFVGVALSAPGENVLSTNWDGGYSPWSGTSIAAPIVAGSAALVLAKNPLFSSSQVRTQLENTARPIPGNPVGMGAGGVNPGEAVGFLPKIAIPLIEAVKSPR